MDENLRAIIRDGMQPLLPEQGLFFAEGVTLTKLHIKSEARRLNATWTIEVSNDVENRYSPEAHAAIVDILSREEEDRCHNN